LKGIVGECQEVLKVSSPALSAMENEDEKDLTIISTPYWLGTHTNTMPSAFVPIIDQLVAFHSIKNGWLIDFDFARPYGLTTTYPPNYQKLLDDGTRLGKPDEIITKSYD
jgi:hypothetical protein